MISFSPLHKGTCGAFGTQPIVISLEANFPTTLWWVKGFPTRLFPSLKILYLQIALV